MPATGSTKRSAQGCWRLARGSEWIWIAGNHDPVPPAWLGGTVAEEVAIGGLLFRHEPLPVKARGEIAGHLHPCATVTRRGHSLRRRCFVSDGARILMPSFGAYAGGLDVGDGGIFLALPRRFSRLHAGCAPGVQGRNQQGRTRILRQAVDASVSDTRK